MREYEFRWYDTDVKSFDIKTMKYDDEKQARLKALEICKNHKCHHVGITSFDNDYWFSEIIECINGNYAVAKTSLEVTTMGGHPIDYFILKPDGSTGRKVTRKYFWKIKEIEKKGE